MALGHSALRCDATMKHTLMKWSHARLLMLPCLLGPLTCTVKLVDSFERRRTSAKAIVKPFSMLSLKLQNRTSMWPGTNCSTARGEDKESFRSSSKTKGYHKQFKCRQQDSLWKGHLPVWIWYLLSGVVQLGDTDRKRRPDLRRALMTDMAVYTTGPDTTRNTNFGGGSTTFTDKAGIYDIDKLFNRVIHSQLSSLC